MNRKAKIVATIGPSSQDEKIFASMVDAGLDVARLNFSHGSYENHLSSIKMIRQVSKDKGKAIAILQDLQGPKVRIGEIPGKSMDISTGQMLDVYFSETIDTIKPLPENTNQWIYIPIPDLLRQLKVGMKILLDDGNIEFCLKQIYVDHVTVTVNLGGTLSSHKGFNLPGVQLDIPGFTEKDRLDLHFGLDNGVDIIAVSFVRTVDDILAVRNEISNYAPDQTGIPIIAKLERPEALENLTSIIKAADGVMVARGDLGVELSPAYVPIAQKKIIREANIYSKPVITATQMLDSMIHNPRPTRAEATDVANAIFDGTDAVMLSGETASGSYPIESIKVMDSIVKEAELNYSDWTICTDLPQMDSTDDAVAMTRAARELAQDRNVSSIAVFTHSGRTALLMSKAKPAVPILAFTPLESSYHKMSLYWGVTPQLVPHANSVESMIRIVDEAIMKFAPEEKDQQVILISGFPINKMRLPNFALLHTVGEPD
jgi:pyruvate kinase